MAYAVKRFVLGIPLRGAAEVLAGARHLVQLAILHSR